MRYAKQSGYRVDICSEVVFDRMRGLCPECGKPVQAFKGRNSRELGGNGQRFHFRHVRGKSKDCVYERVSPLHDFAQNCFIEKKGMYVPFGDGHGLFEGTGRWIVFSSEPKLEYLVHGREGAWRRVDIMVKSDDVFFKNHKVGLDNDTVSIAIEVTVTNGLSPSRVKSLKSMRHLVLEIDLSDFDLVDFDEKEVYDAMINRTSCKVWRREGDRRLKPSCGKLIDEEEDLLREASQTDMFEPVDSVFW